MPGPGAVEARESEAIQSLYPECNADLAPETSDGQSIWHAALRYNLAMPWLPEDFTSVAEAERFVRFGT